MLPNVVFSLYLDIYIYIYIYTVDYNNVHTTTHHYHHELKNRKRKNKANTTRRNNKDGWMIDDTADNRLILATINILHYFLVIVGNYSSNLVLVGIHLFLLLSCPTILFHSFLFVSTQRKSSSSLSLLYIKTLRMEDVCCDFWSIRNS